MQSIPHYSVCLLSCSHHCVDAFQIKTQDLVQLHSWVSFECVEGFPPSEPTHSCLKLSQARDKSCEVSSSLTFHLLHLSPSMARLRAPSTYSSWLQCLTLLYEPPCLVIVCAEWFHWLIAYLHMHMFACMLYAFIIINCSLVHDHFICLYDISLLFAHWGQL